MAGLRVEVLDDGSFRLAGELDMATAAEFHRSVAACLDGQGEVVLDLSDLTFLGSDGIRAFLILAGQIRPRQVVLRAPQPQTARVLEIVGVDRTGGLRVERAST